MNSLYVYRGYDAVQQSFSGKSNLRNVIFLYVGALVFSC